MAAPANLLLLFSDEHEARQMGCAGSALAHTPNLDRLAARGTRFCNAWTPSPICVPARASLATGRPVHRDGYWDNAIAYDGRVPSWGHRLQAAGHRVESIGKLHYRNAEDDTGFDRQTEAMHILDGIGQVWGSVRDPLPETTGPSRLFDRFGPGESPYNRYDMRIADAAVDWLHARAAEPQGKPWTLFVGMVAPHFPLIVPQRYIDGIDVEALPLPKLMPRDGHARHPWVERMARFQDADAALGTDARRRLALACYFGLVRFMDEQMGRVLDALDQSGHAGSTCVVYSSDHGDNLGARGMWNKSLLYRESTGVPLIVAGPGVPHGQVRATNASLLDIAPTVLDCAGLAPDETLPGRSLLQLAGEPDDRQRLGFSEYHAVGSPSAAFMLARGRYKYHHYIGYRPELFDLAADPEESIDLAPDPRHRDVVQGFKAALRAMLDPEAVDARAKADQNALVARFGGPAAALNVGAPAATPAPEAKRQGAA